MPISVLCDKCGFTYDQALPCDSDISFMNAPIHKCSQSRFDNADPRGTIICDNNDEHCHMLTCVGRIYKIKCEKCNKEYYKLFSNDSDLGGIYFIEHQCYDEVKEPE